MPNPSAFSRLQGGDRLLEHALAALPIGIRGAVVGQRADDLDLLIGQERREVLLRRELQHGQVASIDHVTPAGPALRHEPTEVRIQLRRPARDVHRGDRRLLQSRETERHRFTAHHFAAIGAGIDVTVAARLVAELADVDLEDLDPP